jgi:hypothetical protein
MEFRQPNSGRHQVHRQTQHPRIHTEKVVSCIGDLVVKVNPGAGDLAIRDEVRPVSFFPSGHCCSGTIGYGMLSLSFLPR